MEDYTEMYWESFVNQSEGIIFDETFFNDLEEKQSKGGRTMIIEYTVNNQNKRAKIYIQFLVSYVTLFLTQLTGQIQLASKRFWKSKLKAFKDFEGWLKVRLIELILRIALFSNKNLCGEVSQEAIVANLRALTENTKPKSVDEDDWYFLNPLKFASMCDDRVINIKANNVFQKLYENTVYVWVFSYEFLKMIFHSQSFSCTEVEFERERNVLKGYLLEVNEYLLCLSKMHYPTSRLSLMKQFLTQYSEPYKKKEVVEPKVESTGKLELINPMEAVIPASFVAAPLGLGKKVTNVIIPLSQKRKLPENPISKEANLGKKQKAAWDEARQKLSVPELVEKFGTSESDGYLKNEEFFKWFNSDANLEKKEPEKEPSDAEDLGDSIQSDLADDVSAFGSSFVEKSDLGESDSEDYQSDARFEDSQFVQSGGRNLLQQVNLLNERIGKMWLKLQERERDSNLAESELPIIPMLNVDVEKLSKKQKSFILSKKSAEEWIKLLEASTNRIDDLIERDIEDNPPIPHSMLQPMIRKKSKKSLKKAAAITILSSPESLK